MFDSLFSTTGYYNEWSGQTLKVRNVALTISPATLVCFALVTRGWHCSGICR